MKETFYFSHDYNARQDPKIKKLIMSQGFESYGLFWAIIEDLYNNANALPTDYESIAFDLRSSPQRIESIINDFGLFVVKDGFFGSLSVERRLNERNERSVKARESAFKRWNKPETDANALPPQSDSNAIKERKGKEIKVNIKDIDNSHDIFLQKLISEDGRHEREAIQMNIKKKITEEICREFNSHLLIENKHHDHFSEWIRHLRNWLVAKPNIKQAKKEKSKVEKIIESSEGAAEILRNMK